MKNAERRFLQCSSRFRFTRINERKSTDCFSDEKKKRVLERLQDWFSNYCELLSTKQILIIDDEADSASVNCAVPNGEDHGEVINEDEATAINRLIRQCLIKSSMSIYIGYTATPYASLLTDPWDISEELDMACIPRFYTNITATNSTQRNERVFF